MNRQQTRIVLTVFSVLFATVTAWLTYQCVQGVRTWLALRETDTVNATIENVRYESRGGSKPRTTMLVDYSFERDGQRETHQTDSIAPLADDRNYFAALQAAFEQKSEVALHVSRSSPDVHAFSKDVSWFWWGVSFVMPLVFGFATFVIARALIRQAKGNSPEALAT